MNKKLLTLTSSLIPMALIAQQRPNIVFILADDMRGSTVEMTGREKAKTPNINSLASDGVSFTNAHIMGGCNGAVSMPSRAMLMTGKYVYNLHKEGAIIPKEHTTLGEVLNQNGYKTYHIGKWHNDYASFNRSFKAGDDIFFGGMADHWNVPLYSYNNDCNYSKKRAIIKEPFKNNNVEYLSGEYMYSGKHSVDIFTERAIEYINRADKSEPFYLNVAYMSPHDPRSTHTSHHEFYNNLEVTVPQNFMKEHPFDNGEMNVRDEVLASKPRDEKEVISQIKDYYAMISHLDNGVGRIIEALKANGLYKNTIIVFSADNGLAVGQHGLMGKQNVYEHSVSVPLIIKDNTNTSSQINNAPCYLIDVMPTLLEYAHIEKPKSVDAISIMPAIKENKSVRTELYYCYREVQRAISDTNWKLIEYNVNNRRHTQLFNLKEDPMECNNLIENRKYKRIVLELHKKMLVQKQATNDNGSFWNGIDTSKW